MAGRAGLRKGMQLFDAAGELIGMIEGARGNTITVGGRHIPKEAVARITQNRAYLRESAVAVTHIARPRPSRAQATRAKADKPAQREVAIVPLDPRDEARLVAELAPPQEPVEEPTGDALVVPLAEERVRVAKRPVERGEVRVRKRVVAESVRVPVELTREAVRVEERALPVRPATGADLFTEETIRVPLRGEEAILSKEAVITGEVAIARETLAERHQIADTVRREQVEVDRGGAA